METELIFHANTDKPEETFKVGFNFGQTLVGGETILMYGEAGAGKTVFTKGLAKALEISQTITSPTFQLKNEYVGKMPLHHLDMYRIADEEEAFESGALDGISLENDVTVVEWAENVQSYFTYEHFKIEIEYLGANDREIRIFKVSY